MLAAVKGIVQGNTVVIEDEDIREYDGTEVIVTLLNSPKKNVEKVPEAINADLMSEVQLHEKLQKGYEDMEAGRVEEAASAFARFRESH